MAYDTAEYERLFQNIPAGWNNLFSNKMWIENGYYALCLAIKTWGGNYQSLLVITSMFIMGCSCLFVYRHSMNVLMSVFLLVCFPFYYTSFDIIRHYLAISFFMLGYKYIRERKPVWYLLFLVMGAQFHSFAYLLVPMYWIERVKWTKYSLAIYIAITVICTLFVDNIARFATLLIGKSVNNYDYWVGSKAGGIGTAFMYFVLAILVVLAYNNKKERTSEDVWAVNSCMLVMAAAVVYTNARIAIRFLVAIIPLVAVSLPYLVCGYANRKSRLRGFVLKWGVIGISVLYHSYMMLINWQRIVPYIPYWK